MRYFTNYWDHRWLKWGQDEEGEVLNHTAGNQFLKRGVGAGDFLYVVTVEKGRLHLLGRLQVEGIYEQQKAERLLRTNNLWPATDHAVAIPGTETRLTLDLIIPTDAVRRLRFHATGNKVSSPKFSGPGRLDQQTFRGVRELTESGAILLDDFLVAPDSAQLQIDEEAFSFPEGRVKYALHKRRERNPHLVEEAKRRASRKNPDLPCAVCAFSFVEAYGSVGEEYIEAHHTVPVSQLRKNASTRVEDIVLVCSNCHRMLHRRRPWITARRLKKLVANVVQ
jgi:hypothetical protein